MDTEPLVDHCLSIICLQQIVLHHFGILLLQAKVSLVVCHEGSYANLSCSNQVAVPRMQTRTNLMNIVSLVHNNPGMLTRPQNGLSPMSWYFSEPYIYFIDDHLYFLDFECLPRIAECPSPKVSKGNNSVFNVLTHFCGHMLQCQIFVALSGFHHGLGHCQIGLDSMSYELGLVAVRCTNGS